MFGSTVHRAIFLVAIGGIAVGLPLNKIVLSIGGLLVSANWLLEGGFSAKWELFKSNRLAQLLLALFFIHVFGLLWSSDINYGLHDIKIKLPLLFFPIILSTTRALDDIERKWILSLFLGTVVITSLINWIVFVHDGLDDDMELRNLSLFTSHIRYSLLVVFALCISMYFAFRLNNFWRIILLFTTVWLVYYTLFSQVLAGILALVFVTIGTVFWIGIKRLKGVWRMTLFIGLLLTISVGTIWFTSNITPSKKEKIVRENLEYTTPSGNTYTHILESDLTENGYYVFYYLCMDELESEWNKVSEIDFSESDKKGNPISGTLVRYMTSKGLRKDSADFTQLSEKDIYYVEQGIASVVYTYGGIKSRLASLGLEFQKYTDGGDPNGSTVMERLEYWNTGVEIIRDNFWFGVGTGDVQQAFNQKYESNNSRLLPENRVRTHQQFMTFWIAFGIGGFLLFLIFHVGFMVSKWRQNDLIPFLFILILLISYLTEDTLETQTGVTFMAFFASLFLHKKS